MCVCSLPNTHVFDMLGFTEEDVHFAQNPTNSIGHSNGDHDLARTVLEVGCQCILFCIGAPVFRVMSRS